MSIFDKFHVNREQRLLDNHEKNLDELFALYHIHPSKIVNFHPTNAELQILAEGGAAADELAAQIRGGVRTSTKVDYHESKTHSNGLPRRGVK